MPVSDDPRRALAARARERGYEPPPPKFGAEQDYRGRDEEAGVDYLQLLLDPQRTALLVIDMQNIFIREGAPIAAPGAARIVPTINRTLATFRRLQLPVIWTAWCHRPDGSNLGRNAAFWRGVAPLAPDDDLALIHPSLDFREGDVVIEKPKYSAFWATDLDEVLRTHGVESLLLCGIATDVCVGQTMVDAYHRDYVCAVLADGTATTTPYQREALWMHESYWGRVLTAEEAEAELLALAPDTTGAPAAQHEITPTKGAA